MACIVPVSELLPAIPQKRIQEEFDAFRAAGEDIAATIDSEHRFVFKTKEQCVDRSVTIRIILPHRYPDEAPFVFFDGIKREDLPRSDNQFILSGQFIWDRNMNALDILNRSREWLKCYNRWSETGVWD